ncbi:uroplakin-1a isoform X3 [Physeter macrocephalus]|nr:uroplakin-1a isoform X3 [Physeter catodon]|eukprot:XP_028333966.1 uroplakin-1a isoform X3 [Physeter catodon]
MLTTYSFECASCITSYTHRDYMVSSPSLITKQMLTFYGADSDQGRELTRLWDRIMIEQECCGTSGPMDWVNFTSAFRATTPEVVFPWPPLCCRRTGNFIPLNEEGCRLGHLDYLFTKGCFEHIGHAIDSYTWGISWFGFAILMWTVRGGSLWAGWDAAVRLGRPSPDSSSPASCDAHGHAFLHHVVRNKGSPRAHSAPPPPAEMDASPLPFPPPPPFPPSPPEMFYQVSEPCWELGCPETPGHVCTDP